MDGSPALQWLVKRRKIKWERKREDDKIWSRHRNMAGPVPSVFRSFQKKCLVGKIVTKNDE